MLEFSFPIKYNDNLFVTDKTNIINNIITVINNSLSSSIFNFSLHYRPISYFDTQITYNIHDLDIFKNQLYIDLISSITRSVDISTAENVKSIINRKANELIKDKQNTMYGYTFQSPSLLDFENYLLINIPKLLDKDVKILIKYITKTNKMPSNKLALKIFNYICLQFDITVKSFDISAVKNTIKNYFKIPLSIFIVIVLISLIIIYKIAQYIPPVNMSISMSSVMPSFTPSSASGSYMTTQLSNIEYNNIISDMFKKDFIPPQSVTQ